jgi:hypothetical protein
VCDEVSRFQPTPFFFIGKSAENLGIPGDLSASGSSFPELLLTGFRTNVRDELIGIPGAVGNVGGTFYAVRDLCGT